MALIPDGVSPARSAPCLHVRPSVPCRLAAPREGYRVSDGVTTASGWTACSVALRVPLDTCGMTRAAFLLSIALSSAGSFGVQLRGPPEESSLHGHTWRVRPTTGSPGGLAVPVVCTSPVGGGDSTLSPCLCSDARRVLPSAQCLRYKQSQTVCPLRLPHPGTWHSCPALPTVSRDFQAVHPGITVGMKVFPKGYQQVLVECHSCFW